MKNINIISGSLISLMMINSSAFATDEENLAIGNVSVTASRSDTKLEAMPQHTTIITKEEIEKSPAQTLDQVLRNIPGMNISGSPYFNNDPTGQSLRMRGLTNAKVLVLLDGIPVHDPFYSTIQWAKMPISSVERVEIIRGGGSALWGNLAVAGVVNVITKRPNDDSTQVGFSYGSLSTSKADISKNIVISDQLKLRVSADYMDTDGYQPLPSYWRSATFLPIPGQSSWKNQDTQRNLRLDGYFNFDNSINGFFKFGAHDQDQYLKLSTGANLYRSYDLAGGLTKNFDANKNLQVKFWYQDVNFDKSNAGGCYWTPGNSCSTTQVASIPSGSTLYSFKSSHDDNPYTELGSSIMFSNTNLDTSSFQLGVDTRRIEAKDTNVSYGTPDKTTLVQTVSGSTFGQTTQDFLGLFGQYKFSPFQGPVELTLNARYDYWRNTDSILTSTNSSGVTTGGVQADKSANGFDPSIGLRYYVGDNFSLRAAAYKSFRAPGINNTYRSYASSTSVSFANPDLKPENLEGAEIGADYKNALMSLGGTFFLYNIDGLNYSYKVGTYSKDTLNNFSTTANQSLITALCQGNPTSPSYSGGCPITTGADVKTNTVNYYTDGVSAKGLGFELTNKWDLSDDLKLILSYAYTDVFLTKKLAVVTDPLNQQLGGVPKNVGVAGVDWRINPKLRLYTQLRAVSSSFADTPHTATLYQPGYMTVDANLTYTFNKHFTITGSIVNLFDKNYLDGQTTSATSLNYGLPFFANIGGRVNF